MRSAWVHLHSGQASSLRPCLCEDGATPEGHTRSPGGRRGGGGSDREGDVFFAGVLFLQFGEETRRVHITHEVSSLDTLHALIAHMFPQKLTMGMLKSPNTAILIKDEARNVFYELEDVRWAWARGRWEGSPLSPAPGCAGLAGSCPCLAWVPSPALSFQPRLFPPSPSALPGCQWTGQRLLCVRHRGKDLGGGVGAPGRSCHIFTLGSHLSPSPGAPNGMNGDPGAPSPARDIQDRSIIKIYRKEPLYAAFPGSHLTNGDLRVRLGMGGKGVEGRLGIWGPCSWPWGPDLLWRTQGRGFLLIMGFCKCPSPPPPGATPSPRDAPGRPQ